MTKNKYVGSFLDRDNNEIQVRIVPNLSSGESLGETKTLTFPYEEPVVITQDSDGIFSPLKTQGCTIRIFTEELHWELYSKSALDWYVEVYNATKDLYLFKGYLTPCLYSQDYAYNGIIELECVDFLAVLENIKYTTITEGIRDIVKVSDIFSHIEDILPNAETDIFIFRVKSSRYFIDPSALITETYLQEANFFDDDDEETPWSFKEVLEEIFRYWGITASMYDGNIILQNIEESTQSQRTTLTLNKDLYVGDAPTLGLEEVYNEISVSCNLYEVDELLDDFFSDENTGMITNECELLDENRHFDRVYWSWRAHGSHTEDKHRYWSLIKPYLFTTQGTDPYQLNRGWYSIRTKISKITPETEIIVDKDTMASLDAAVYKETVNEAYTWVPQYSGAYPVRQYTYSKDETLSLKTSVDWQELIAFPIRLTHKDDAVKSTSWETDPIEGDKFKYFYRHNTPALRYYNPDRICYTTPTSDGVTTQAYINIDASVLWATTNGIKGVDDKYGNIDMPFYYGEDKEQVQRTKPSCLSEFDLDGFDGDDDDIAKKPGENKYREGFPMFRAMLRIGDKYWSADTNQWTTTKTYFYLRFHKDDVDNPDNENEAQYYEHFSIYEWMKIAPNKNVTGLLSGADCYSIPVDYNVITGGLYGDLEFIIYNPVGLTNGWQKGEKDKQLRQTNILFMKDLKIEYSHQPYMWYEDEKEDEDIEYKTDEDISSYAQDFSGIDCKINSYYTRKPCSKSYALISKGLPVSKGLFMVYLPEEILLDKYYVHHKEPKAVLNITYHPTTLDPIPLYYHPTLKGGTYFIQDSFEYDVKQNAMSYKLIEL